MAKKYCWLCDAELNEEDSKRFGMPITQLGLTDRTTHCLVQIDITTIEQLLELKDEELIRKRNIGQTRFKEIKNRLEIYVQKFNQKK